MEPLFVGIEIGGTKLQLVVGRADGRIVERRRRQVTVEAGGVGIREQIAQEVGNLCAAFKPVAISVGFGGPVDRKRGRIACSHQIEGWADFPLRDWLAELSNLPVLIENDANTAALGEAVCGAGKGFNPVFYLTLGSGVGGGLVVNRQIYHGSFPGEAEIGHVRLDPQGATVESRCSGWAVDKKIRHYKARQAPGILVELACQQEGGEARWLKPALQAGDPLARQILNETATDLAFALSHVVHLFHPEVMVVGGGLSLVGEPLRRAISEFLPGFVMQAFHPVPQILLAALREDAVPVGALVAAAQLARA